MKSKKISTAISPCVLCNNSGAYIEILHVNELDAKVEKFHCTRCGTYHLDYEYVKKDLDKMECAATLYHHLMHKNDREVEYVYSKSKSGGKDTVIWIDVRNLVANMPDDLDERIEKTIINLYNMYGLKDLDSDLWTYQLLIERLTFTDPTALHTENLKEILRIYETLLEEGYLSIHTNDYGRNVYRLTKKAIDKAQKLIKKIKMNSRAFIAISYKDEMRPIADVISQAVRECGYIPVIMNQEEHNEPILQKIQSNIKDCHFVIADLTHNSKNVHYEIGYADGLKKAVIITSKHDEEVSIDLSHRLMVKYLDGKDLKDLLKKRILHSIGQCN